MKYQQRCVKSFQTYHHVKKSLLILRETLRKELYLTLSTLKQLPGDLSNRKYDYAVKDNKYVGKKILELQKVT